MAKKRRVKNSGDATDARSRELAHGKPSPHQQAESDQAGPGSLASQCVGSPFAQSGVQQTNRVEPLAIASALLAGAIVYVTYHPSDSVAVERGDALWFGVLAIVTATLTLAACVWRNRRSNQASATGAMPATGLTPATGLAIDLLACALPLWIMLSAFTTSPPGNLRMATNEGWLWVSGAAIFLASRRLMNSLSVRRGIITVLIACSVGVAMHGLHQQWISLPKTRMEYQSDPDKMLAAAQIYAPAGSVQRMVFENRLFDGGPTGTFALANSLAGLLVVGCVLTVGVLRFQWNTLCNHRRAVWLLPLTLGVLALLAARSRSATAACLLGTIAICVAGSLVSPKAGDSQHRSQTRPLRLAFLSLAALVVSGLGVGSLIAAVGNKEWFEQAPASIAFRFQYWRSTWQMALDSPWWGVGPGNFQSLYQRYREETTNESVADAHNFLFETLAAGGFVGLVLLLGLLATMAWVVKQRLLPNNAAQDNASQDNASQHNSPQNETADDESQFAKWVWLGGGLSLVMVWLIGAAAGMTPDFEAHKIAVPIALAAGYLVWPAIRLCSAITIDWIMAVAGGCLMIHLLVAGGWTVPGVAMPLWIFGGCITRTSLKTKTRAADQSVAAQPASESWAMWPTVAVILCGLTLLLVHRFVSLGPVQAAESAMRAAAYAQSQNQIVAVNQSVERAIAADTWSPDASMYKADLLHWELATRGDSDSLRSQWRSQLDESLVRAGENPTAYRDAAFQSLHLYQCFGNPAYLRAAHTWITQAARWSPVDLVALAQLAATSAERGEMNVAKEIAEKLDRLSRLVDNPERQLSRQMIYEPRPIGQSAAKGPVIRPATEVLQDLLPVNQTATPPVTPSK